MNRHNGSTYDSRHFKCERTCKGLHLDGGDLEWHPGVVIIVIAAAFLLLASMWRF